MSQQDSMGDRQDSLAARLSPAEKAEVVREAYCKHAAELLAIEEAQQKLAVTVLVILGGGASFIGGLEHELSTATQVGLTVVVVMITLVGLVHTILRSRARGGTRALLVCCEEALGFFEAGAYVPDEQLYREKLKEFPQSGWWLPLAYGLALAAAAGFLIVIWSM